MTTCTYDKSDFRPQHKALRQKEHEIRSKMHLTRERERERGAQHNKLAGHSRPAAVSTLINGVGGNAARTTPH